VYPRGKSELAGNKVHGKFVRDLAKAWVQMGAEVHVLTPHSIQTAGFEKLDGVNVHRFHYFFRESWETLTYGDGIPQNIKKLRNKMLVPFLAFMFWWQGLQLVRKHNIPIINAHWAVPTGYIALWIKIFTKVKVVTTVYGAELFPVIAGRMRFLKPFLVKAMNSADITVGISRATVDTAIEISNRKDIHIVPDGIDVDYYRPAARDIVLLQKYNCRNSQVIFFSGRMVERKGHRYVLEAMKSLRDKLPNVKLILGGKGPLFDDLVKWRKELMLQDVVEMPGFIPEEDMVPLLQSADVFILPSCIDQYGDTEGSATAALEAMACGTPAVISNVGGNIGAIDHGKGALYFESTNVQDLSSKILGLLRDTKDLKRNSIEARDYIVNHYSWARIIEKYSTLLGEYEFDTQESRRKQYE